MARTIRAAGGRPGMMAHIAYGYGLFTGGLGYHYGAERLGCTIVPVSGGMTARQVQLIYDFAPDILMATSSYAFALVDEFRAQGLDPRRSSLKLGSFGAEPWTNAMRDELEDAFDIDALDSYGLSEVIGPGVAGECVETKDGLHIWEDHFYPEIVDPADRRRAADGEIRRARSYVPDQGGDAGDPLPHRRFDPIAAGHRAFDAADGESVGPIGRHDDRARRQRVSNADRGAAAWRSPAFLRTISSFLPENADWTNWRFRSRRDRPPNWTPRARMRPASSRTRSRGTSELLRK